MCAEDGIIYAPDTRDVVHIDEVEHAPSVPELRGIVEVRPHENAAVTFVPMFWGYNKPRVANLGRDRAASEKPTQIQPQPTSQPVKNPSASNKKKAEPALLGWQNFSRGGSRR